MSGSRLRFHSSSPRRVVLGILSTASLLAGMLVAPSFPVVAAHAASTAGPPKGHPPAPVTTQPSALVPSAHGDVAVLRTATTQTFPVGNGRFEERLFANPVNFKGTDGTWQPIDTTLKELSPQTWCTTTLATCVS